MGGQRWPSTTLAGDTNYFNPFHADEKEVTTLIKVSREGSIQKGIPSGVSSWRRDQVQLDPNKVKGRLTAKKQGAGRGWKISKRILEDQAIWASQQSWPQWRWGWG
jgi:hypothetical protein